jgi:phage anti-repressor protein
MNRTCHGVFFPVIKKYRCLLSGDFIDMESPQERCPVCNRKFTMTIDHAKEITKVIVTYIKSESLGWLEVKREECK